MVLREDTNMKKLLAGVLAAVMLLGMVACSGSNSASTKTALDNVIEKGEITVAISPDFAPSEFKDPSTGEVLGSDVFVAQYIADYLSKKYDKEIKLVIEEMDFKSCQAAVSTGTVDFSVNAFAATDERKENFICSSHYGMTDDSDSFQGFLVHSEDASKFAKPEDFSGKTIAVQLASLQYNLVTAQLPEDIKIEYITTVTQGALMLANGNVDALATTSETGSLLMGNYEGLSMADFHLDYSSEGSVALINLNNQELADAINEAIEDMVANVNWPEIRQQYTDIAAELGVTNE